MPFLFDDAKVRRNSDMCKLSGGLLALWLALFSDCEEGTFVDCHPNG